MRIAQISPLYEMVPPHRYGGTERVIAALCNGLVARGHDVTLFAPGGSTTDAELSPVVPEPLREKMTKAEMEYVAPHIHLHALEEIFARADEFDVLHAHTDIWTLPFMRSSDAPVLLTMHGRLDIPQVQATMPHYPHEPLVSISDYQRRPLAHVPINWAGTAYNGLPLERYLAQPRGDGDYLAFCGRINPEKRPDWAVQVAHEAGMPLRVAAKVDPCDVDYWENEIRPLFRRYDVDYLGEITEDEKPEFYAGARALVFPIDWPEPFGLVMVESLASGTPVITRNCGSVPEIITDGVSGLVRDTIGEMAAAVEHVQKLDARACRREAQRFSQEAMVERYLELYDDLLGSARIIDLDAILTDGAPSPAETTGELAS